MAHTLIPVFDLGRVLLDWDPRYLYRSMFSDAEAMERFLAEVLNRPWIDELDRGAPIGPAIERLVEQHPEHEAAIRAFDHRWDETLPRAIEGTVEILETLRRNGLPTYAVTNFAEDNFNRSVRRFPFLAGFDGVVVSAIERLIKPDPEIFAVLFRRYGLEPGRCLFIDDIAANVAAAKDVGMQAVQFTDPATLARDLAAAGLPVA